jgi:hypothetical protein
MEIAQAIIGVALLGFGRKGLPLFLTAFGALAGMTVAHSYFPAPSSGMMIAAIIVGGLLGALTAFFIQKVAVFLAGVLGGGYVGYLLALQMGWIQNGFPWIPVVACAVVGLFFAHFILKWALIVLSSVVGAFLLVSLLHLSPSASALLTVGVAAAGIWFQTSSGSSKKAG